MDVVQVQPNTIGDVAREAAVRKPLCHTPKGERVPPRPTEEADIKHADVGGTPQASYLGRGAVVVTHGVDTLAADGDGHWRDQVLKGGAGLVFQGVLEEIAEYIGFLWRVRDPACVSAVVDDGAVRKRGFRVNANTAFFTSLDLTE